MNISIRNIGSILLIAMAIAGCSRSEKRFVEFEGKIKKSVDPEKFQSWALLMIKAHKAGDNIEMKDLPEEIKWMGPSSNMFVSAGWDGSNQKNVVVLWSQDGRYFGLVAGDKNFSATAGSVSKIMEKWIPGVYFMFK